MSTLYSHPDFPEKGPEEINQELMKNVSHNPLLLLTPQKVKRYVESLWKKKRSGQPVTFADIFGMLIGETLIHNVSYSSIYNLLIDCVYHNVLNKTKYDIFCKSHLIQLILSTLCTERA